MSKGLLTLFSGAIVLLLLFAFAPAQAADLYRSNLVCSTNFGGPPVPIAASGSTAIRNTGVIHVSLQDLSVPDGTKFSCTIFCPLTNTSNADPDCGGRVSSGGSYDTDSRRIVTSPPLSALCAEPSVEVVQQPFGSGFNKVFCESGFVTRDP